MSLDLSGAKKNSLLCRKDPLTTITEAFIGIPTKGLGLWAIRAVQLNVPGPGQCSISGASLTDFPKMGEIAGVAGDHSNSTKSNTTSRLPTCDDRSHVLPAHPRIERT